MTCALTRTSRSMFFTAENGQYRYWLKAGVLKIQITRAALRKFQASEAGRRLARYIDLFEIGGGWYAVHEGPDVAVLHKFGTQSSGVKMWVKALNQFFLSAINANVPTVVAVYTTGRPTPVSGFLSNVREPIRPHVANEPYQGGVPQFDILKLDRVRPFRKIVEREFRL